MIFLTTGTQLPFDRLVRSVDAVASELEEAVFGQIGSGIYRPTNFSYAKFLSQHDFSTRFEAARLVVAHAGTGSILAGIKMEKPVVVMPRRADLGEHRNDHQLATAEHLRDLPGLYLATTTSEIRRFLSDPELQPMQRERQESTELQRLINRLRHEVFTA